MAASLEAVEDDGSTWRPAHPVTIFLNGRGHWRDWVIVQTTALRDAIRSGDPTAQAWVPPQPRSGLVEFAEHERADAHLASARELYARLGDLAA